MEAVKVSHYAVYLWVSDIMCHYGSTSHVCFLWVLYLYFLCCVVLKFAAFTSEIMFSVFCTHMCTHKHTKWHWVACSNWQSSYDLARLQGSPHQWALSLFSHLNGGQGPAVLCITNTQPVIASSCLPHNLRLFPDLLWISRQNQWVNVKQKEQSVPDFSWLTEA